MTSIKPFFGNDDLRFGGLKSLRLNYCHLELRKVLASANTGFEFILFLVGAAYYRYIFQFSFNDSL